MKEIIVKIRNSACFSRVNHEMTREEKKKEEVVIPDRFRIKILTRLSRRISQNRGNRSKWNERHKTTGGSRKSRREREMKREKRGKKRKEPRGNWGGNWRARI